MLLIASCDQVPVNWHRYEEANAKLLPPKDGEDRVVFMGNSITAAWLELRPEFFAGKPYVNRGIGGETTPQMLGRFQQDVIDLEPKVVVILAGINDIAGNTGPITIPAIVANIVKMVEMAEGKGIKVVLCSVLPANRISWRPKLEPADQVVQLNSLLREYAEKNKLEYVDYYTPMVNDSGGLLDSLGRDDVHPDANGYLVMEPLLEEALADVLSGR